jgi:Domain of unknown function (DUF6458)
MGIGASIFLIAVGAIIAYGINARGIGWLDLDVVGWVLMLAGLAGLLTTLWFWRRRRAVHPTALDDDRGLYSDERPRGGYTEEYRHEVHPPERRL